jgi:hypothetical protein
MFEKWFGKKKVAPKEPEKKEDEDKDALPMQIVYSTEDLNVFVTIRPSGKEECSQFISILNNLPEIRGTGETTGQVAIYEPIGAIYKFKRIEILPAIPKVPDASISQPTEGEHHD